MKHIILTVILFFTIISFGQNQNDFGKVLESKNIIYCGFDFSQFRLSNADKIGQENEIGKFFRAWISYFESDVNIPKELYKNTSKEVYRNTNEIQLRSELLPERWIVYNENHLDINQIQETIKSYNLRDTVGVGLVAIVENFSKTTELAYIWWVFFDLDSKEVIWANVTDGRASKGVGMTRHWGSAMVLAHMKFRNLYRSDLKRAKKKKS